MSKDFIDETNYKEFDYVTYPRQFNSYRWFKPILTLILFAFFFIILGTLVTAAAALYHFLETGGDINGFIERFKNVTYDNMSVHDLTGCLVYFGTLAMIIPALAMARGIVRDRSFASYSSSRGGWSHTVFFKSLIIAILVFGSITYIHTFGFHAPGPYNNQFTKAGLIALCILCPLQCLGEEYAFRALLTQTLGSWTRLPILSITLVSVGFAALHPYDRMGQIGVVASGLGLGLAAWIGHGLEVPAALHIVNNLSAFLLEGFGYQKISSSTSKEEMVVTILVNLVYVLAILFISMKTDWFDRLKYNDAGDWNILLDDKRKRKAAKKAARKAKKEARKNR